MINCVGVYASVCCYLIFFCIQIIVLLLTNGLFKSCPTILPHPGQVRGFGLQFFPGAEILDSIFPRGGGFRKVFLLKMRQKHIFLHKMSKIFPGAGDFGFSFCPRQGFELKFWPRPGKFWVAPGGWWWRLDLKHP